MEKKKLKQIKTAFDRLTSRLGTAEEKISRLKDISLESSKAEKQREQWQKKTTNKTKQNNKNNRISKDYGKSTKGVTYTFFQRKQ